MLPEGAGGARLDGLEMRGRLVEWPRMEEIVGHLESEIEHVAPLLRAQAASGRAPQVPARGGDAKRRRHRSLSPYVVA